MKTKFKDFLENLSYSEVMDFQQQIKDKQSTIRQVLDNHIDVTERINARICATCGNQLHGQENALTLHFGPNDFKKKASFCAFDCMEFFLDQLKSIELKKIKQEGKQV